MYRALATIIIVVFLAFFGSGPGVRGASADDTKPDGSAPAVPLFRPPTHRFSFDGKGGDGAQLTDSIGNAHGQVYVKPAPKPLPYTKAALRSSSFPTRKATAANGPRSFTP